MTDDERTEGARAVAAVMIPNGVAYDTLSEQVKERCAQAYEAAAATRERQQMARYLAPMNLVPADVDSAHAAALGAAHEVFTDYPADPLFGGDDGGDAEREAQR